MQVIIVGSGKLATELLRSLKIDGCQVASWGETQCADQSVVVHAGSGRELEAVLAFCQATRSPLVELATGSLLAGTAQSFPVVLCPNTNILMLKFMAMLEESGPRFRGCEITLVESHQAQKTSRPGTAVQLAHSLGLQAGDIRSIRDPGVQRAELQIPGAHLARHAFHQINIKDGECSLKLESRVFGESPYADGVARIVQAVRSQELENRSYSIMEFVRNGWL